jgi:hypothetical protein
MKRYLLTLLVFLSFQIQVCSQQLRMISIKLTSTDELAFANHNVYIQSYDSDSIVYKSCTSPDGIARFFIDEASDTKGLLLTIRQNDNQISRIPLAKLLDYDSSILMPKMVLSVTENRLLSIEESRRKLERSFNNTVSGSSIRFSDGLLSVELERLFGYVRWYFPTEVFLQPKELYYEYIKKEYNKGFAIFQTCEDGLDHYPTDSEMDSLASIIAWKNAEMREGVFCYYLMRLDEPVLCDSGYHHDVYRLSWIDENYVYVYDTYAFRLEIDEKGRTIMYVSYRYVDDCLGDLLYCDVIPLEESQSEQFYKLIEDGGFWEDTSCCEKNDMVSSGATFIMEGFKDESYNVVIRDARQQSLLYVINKLLWGYSGLGKNRLYQSHLIE